MKSDTIDQWMLILFDFHLDNYFHRLIGGKLNNKIIMDKYIIYFQIKSFHCPIVFTTEWLHVSSSDVDISWRVRGSSKIFWLLLMGEVINEMLPFHLAVDGSRFTLAKTFPWILLFLEKITFTTKNACIDYLHFGLLHIFVLTSFKPALATIATTTK